jgi:hypothetical protein
MKLVVGEVGEGGPHRSSGERIGFERHVRGVCVLASVCLEAEVRDQRGRVQPAEGISGTTSRARKHGA